MHPAWQIGLYRLPPLFYNLIYCIDISCQQQPRPPALVHLRLIPHMTTGQNKADHRTRLISPVGSSELCPFIVDE